MDRAGQEPWPIGHSLFRSKIVIIAQRPPAQSLTSSKHNVARKVTHMAKKGLEGIDETVQQTHIWINEIRDELHSDEHQAWLVLRGFLHVLRDRLTIDESAQLASQLPMLIRGLYYEGWDPPEVFQPVRDAQVFLDRFAAEAQVRGQDAGRAITAAGRTLQAHISGGEVEDVLNSLPAQIRALVSGESTGSARAH